MEQIANGIWKLVLGEPEDKTPVSFQTVPMKTESLKNLPLRNVEPFICSKIDFQITQRGTAVTLPMGTEEDIYGFGLQLKSMNHAGTFTDEPDRNYVIIRSDENESLSWKRNGKESIRYEFQEGGII